VREKRKKERKRERERDELCGEFKTSSSSSAPMPVRLSIAFACYRVFAVVINGLLFEETLEGRSRFAFQFLICTIQNMSGSTWHPYILSSSHEHVEFIFHPNPLFLPLSKMPFLLAVIFLSSFLISGKPSFLSKPHRIPRRVCVARVVKNLIFALTSGLRAQK
jgi:hypothetical protein